jgi:hypothetical protein
VRTVTFFRVLPRSKEAVHKITAAKQIIKATEFHGIYFMIFFYFRDVGGWDIKLKFL